MIRTFEQMRTARTIHALGDAQTRGFDIDSIYCEVSNGKISWTIFEFLKCDTVNPEDSHPRRYWNGKTSNRKKFLSLWTLVQSLQHGNVSARLLLVNYRDDKSAVKVLTVISMTDESIETKENIMTYSEWCTHFRRFNKEKIGATWEAIELLNSDGS